MRLDILDSAPSVFRMTVGRI